MITETEMKDFVEYLDAFCHMDIEAEELAISLIWETDFSDPNVRRVYIPAKYVTLGNAMFYTF